nr:MAG TPA: hypothetical protein [Caudoviricetes sp.]DAU59319.1 MAG TPA: hypothetical protein [Crassvirales sp.]
MYNSLTTLAIVYEFVSSKLYLDIIPSEPPNILFTKLIY